MSGVPERIGKYRVVEVIGRGGMGSVYKAHDALLDRMVAIKVMAEESEGGAEARARFLREAQSAARLNHSNIITVYELGEDQGQIFIVMELLEGQPLSRIIDQVSPPPLRRKLGLMIQVCEGLAFAHQRGVVHRDIKPANVFVLENGQVKILDFGIARVGGSDLTRTGLLMGTPNYMSPEQARGRRTDARSDIFSVGAVFYELLSSRKPFAADDYFETMEKVRSEDPLPLQTLVATLPPRLTQAVHRALAKDPGARYQTLEELQAELTAVRDSLEGDATEELREAVSRKFGEIVRLHRMLVSSVGGAAVGDETLPMADPNATGAGLRTLLQDLEARAERLQTFAGAVERLEPAVERGVAAFERGAFAEAVATLEAVLAEIPLHQRARDYRDRARLEETRQRTMRSLGPVAAPAPAGRAPVATPRPEPATPAREAAAATAVVTPPPGGPMPAPGTLTEVTQIVSGRRGRMILAGVAVLAVVGGGALIFSLKPREAPAPAAPPPAVTAPQPAAPEAPKGADQPAPGSSAPKPPARPTPAPAGPGATAPSPKPAASRPALTAEQRKTIEDALTLAQLFQTRGDSQRAKREFQRVLDLDPSNSEARQGLAEAEEALKKKP